MHILILEKCYFAKKVFLHNLIVFLDKNFGWLFYFN